MGFAGTFAWVSLATALANAASPPPALDDVLAAARAASGAPFSYHLRSVSSSEDRLMPVVVTSESEGRRYLVRRCRALACDGTFVDGTQVEQINANGTALPVAPGAPSVEPTLRAIATYAFAAPDFRASGGTLALHGLVPFDGAAALSVSVTAPGGLPMEALLDPATRLVTAARFNGGRSTLRFEDRRRVDGKLVLPFAVTLDGRVVERYDRREIVTEPLVAPRGLVPVFPEREARVAMLHDERDDALPVIGCTLGGKPARCLLDSGDSGLALSLEFAESLGLEPAGGAFEISGVGRYATGLVAAPPLAIGDVRYPAATYAVLDDIDALGFDVVLGADVFANARITLDYAKRSVTFAPPAARDATLGLPLAFEDFLPQLVVGLGDLDVPLAIDTGDASAINLSAGFYAAHPSLFTPQETRAVAGVGGASEQRAGELARTRVGPYVIAGQRIGVTEKLLASTRGHVGSALLAHFTTVFDYAAGRIELTPRPGDTAVSTLPAWQPAFGSNRIAADMTTLRRSCSRR
jgi:hypothetical protein